MAETNGAGAPELDAVPELDVVIVGGGPAGLSAALVLARCRRRIVVFDSGRYRNARAKHLNAYLTRDGTPPSEFLDIARREVAAYGVEVRRVLVTGACTCEGGYEVTLETGERVRAHTLLLATGVADRPPAVEGLEQFYGVTVVHCPYCDGWELRERPIGVYGHGHGGASLALALLNWSDDVTLFTDGYTRVSRADRGQLAARGVRVETARIERLQGTGDQLERIVLVDGRSVPCRGLFLTTPQVQRSDLAPMLGCTSTPRGAIRTGRFQESSVRGVYVVGDSSQDPQLAIIAAAEGAKAAFAIHTALLEQRLGAPEQSPATRAAGA